MIIPAGPRGRFQWTLAVAAIAAVGGAIVALHYQQLGLTLSHYDARGHLVVARRILDSITPGWQQIGAVWLPLPHLLNMLPVQIDAFYRTGASAVAISVLSFAVATAGIAWIVRQLTGSLAAAVAGAAVFALNPNVLYLQSTPLAEPLLLALTVVGVALLIQWCNEQAPTHRGTEAQAPQHPRTYEPMHRRSLVGCVFALACLTRYEAWPVTAYALVAAAWVLWIRGDAVRDAGRRVMAIAVYPALAVVAFLIFSRVVIGEWFVSSGFFVPENKALNDPIESLAEIWWGAHMLSSYALVVVGLLGLAWLKLATFRNRERASGVIAVSFAAAAALPWAAFIKGHPFRIRYMVPLIAAQAVGAGFAAGYVRRAAPIAAAILLALTAYKLRPLDPNAPMVVEAQWDRPNVPARQQVTRCLALPLRGAKIMASMGSLGHYIQETSAVGLNIRDFLHEGNGDIWLAALAMGARPFADWVLIEEKAEGGDMLAKLAQEEPRFLAGYSRVCEGAGVALYRRDEAQNLTLITNR